MADSDGKGNNNDDAVAGAVRRLQQEYRPAAQERQAEVLERAWKEPRWRRVGRACCIRTAVSREAAFGKDGVKPPHLEETATRAGKIKKFLNKTTSV